MSGRPVLVLALVVTALAGPAVRADDTPDPLAQAPSHFAKLDDIRIHYKSLGEGKTALVFVHGWTCNMNAWRHQAPAFVGKTRLILIDLPGHGQSDKPKIDYTMDLFARAVNAVLSNAGVDKAIFVGHSMGTPVIRQFYRLYPEKTKALVVVDGALRAFIKKPEDFEKFVSRFKGPDFKETLSKFVDGMVAPQAPPEVRQEIHAIMPSAPQDVAVSAMRGMFDPTIWKDDQIKVPVLAIMAKNPNWSADYQKYVHQLAPDLDYQPMAGVGHFLMMEKPQEFNALLAGFLKKQGVVNEKD